LNVSAVLDVQGNKHPQLINHFRFEQKKSANLISGRALPAQVQTKASYTINKKIFNVLTHEVLMVTVVEEQFDILGPILAEN